MRNISGDNIRCPCKRCKNRKLLDWDVTMHLLQIGFMEKYLCWFAHKKLYVPYKTMIERMVESTFNSSNVHRVVNDNSNLYINMIMDTMRINHDYIGECPIIHEESNVDTTRFLIF